MSKFVASGPLTLRWLMLGCAGLFGVFSLWLVVSGPRAVVPYLALLACCALLLGGNFQSADRHRQWGTLLLAVVACVIVLAVVYLSDRAYQRLIETVSEQMTYLSKQFGLTWGGSPATASAAHLPVPGPVLACVNLLFLLCVGIVKLLMYLGARFVWKSPSLERTEIQPAIGKGAYERLPELGWSLRYQWVFVRHVAVGLCLASLVLLVLFFANIGTEFGSRLVPILPACALFLFGELAAYLGGGLQHAGTYSFDGDDVNGAAFADYERVWASLCRLFSDFKLAAGRGEPGEPPT